MKLIISKLGSKSVETQYGKKNRVSFQCNGEWYSAFQNPQTDLWKNGMEIEVDVKKNGNFNNIIFPKESSNGNGHSEGGREPPLVIDYLVQIQKEVLAIKALLQANSTTNAKDDGAPF